MKEFKYLRPVIKQEAVSLKATYGDKAKFIAGGTDLMVQMRRKKVTPPDYVIDISNLSELDYINYSDGSLKIGAVTKIRSIEKSSLVKKNAELLVEAAHNMAAVQIRNMGTIGGNICNAAPSADLAVPLLALGAKMKLFDPSVERDIPVDEFFVGPSETIIKNDEILVEVQIPKLPPRSGTAFLKIGRTAMDLALVNVAVSLTIGIDEKCSDAKIALGAVAPTPIRCKEAEKMLMGAKVNEALIDKVGTMAAEESKPISDIRASASFRKEISNVLVRRALSDSLKKF